MGEVKDYLPWVLQDIRERLQALEDRQRRYDRQQAVLAWKVGAICFALGGLAVWSLPRLLALLAGGP